MPTQNTSIFSPATPGIEYAGAGKTWTIAKGVSVGSKATAGVYSPFKDSTLVNKGVAYSLDYVAVHFEIAKNGVVMNKSSGTILGFIGVYLQGGPTSDKNASVHNDGNIVGTDSIGVYLRDMTNSHVYNSGEIFGSTAGVYFEHSVSTPPGGSKVENSGLIHSNAYGVLSDANPGLKTTVVNKEGGTIKADAFSVIAIGGALKVNNKGKLKGNVFSTENGAKDKVINEGQIKGDVRLFTGNDVFKNKGGTAGKVFSGDGDDNLIAGSTKDKFVFDGPLNEATNIDRIEKFESGKDMFFLAQNVFTVLPLGSLANSAFEKGKEADDIDDRIIYHKGSGQLSYDPDGLGGADQIQIAQLDPGQKLAAGDFTVELFA